MSGRRPLQGESTVTGLGAAEFGTALAALGPWEGHPRLALAVSGGPDSMALALLSAAWVRERGGDLICLIVDHGLRPDSAPEAEQVRQWLLRRELAACVLRAGTIGIAAGRGSVQERARRLRYRLLIEHCIEMRRPHLLLAHHREDQAETVLMRIARGSGLRGLAAIAPAALAPGSGGRVRLLRPLLGTAKERLRRTLEEAGQPWVEDPSNRDRRHERVRWRALAPVLAAAGVEPARLATGAARFAEERRVLDRAAAAWLGSTASPSIYGHVTVEMDRFADLDPPVAEAALARLLGAVSGNPYPPRRDSLARLGAELRRAPARLTRTLAGCVLALANGRLTVMREPSAVVEIRAAHPGLLLWDGRFELRLDGPVERWEGITISCLGREGLAEARLLSRRIGARPPRAPAGQLCSLPALRDGRGLVEVPHLPGFSGAERLTRVAWAPRQPLTG